MYDNVYRGDVLEEAWERTRSNGGAAGIDERRIEDVEKYGVQKRLGELAQELRDKSYRPQPVRRVYIPKPDGKQRPLGVRCFQYVPLWGLAVMLVYAMRRVHCAQCGVKVERVPWASSN